VHNPACGQWAFQGQLKLGFTYQGVYCSLQQMYIIFNVETTVKGRVSRKVETKMPSLLSCKSSRKSCKHFHFLKNLGEDPLHLAVFEKKLARIIKNFAKTAYFQAAARILDLLPYQFGEIFNCKK
jgi:hypothetical protein